MLPLAKKLNAASSASHIGLTAYEHAHAACMPRHRYMDSQEDFMVRYTNVYHQRQKCAGMEHCVWLYRGSWNPPLACFPKALAEVL